MGNQVVSVIGARPQFVKAAMVSRALEGAGISEEVIHTGQHYDLSMSDAFLSLFGIENISKNLGVGSGSHGAQTASMMSGIEDFLLARVELPSAILLYGDTNSTLAGALVASKLHIPIVHVEAGLRSFNRQMPEEVNRVVVDHLSSLLFCSSKTGVLNLKEEGILEGVHMVGDVMLDAFVHFSAIAMTQEVEDFPDDFVLVTIHRPSNVDDVKQLKRVVESLASLDRSVIWPIHPRTESKLEQVPLPESFHIVQPFDYLQMLQALNATGLVVTDSGGLQKEAYWAKKPCLTMRDDTEWTETLADGWNQLCKAGDDLAAFALRDRGDWIELYGDGRASQKIAEEISSFVEVMA